MLVAEMFSSIQGEGINTGTPAYFLRLGPCNLDCPFCDEPLHKDASKWKDIPLEEVAETILNGINKNRLLIITGGEPLLQYGALNKMIYIFMERCAMFEVWIETNGSVNIPSLDMMPLANYSVSPKEGALVQNSLITLAKEFKFVANKNNIETVVKRAKGIRKLCYDHRVNNSVPLFWLQPENGEKDLNLDNARSCAFMCEANPWLRLSLQIHKVLGMK